ncbi:MAG TPA: hypothetical protein VFV67_12500 [Actinophytocola sp.]|uniref:hypothetical protein n=1 Tax=Actinophytocola sp. TaxID=1872138 RepID=UPI002DB56FE1|nr:hypothetical protein [Actinophytocola sp.]HEU5471467.1 hypothetical protein [Actinophytocola sp.]
MTGPQRPNWTPATSRLRTFCAAAASLFLACALGIALLRPLIVPALVDTAPFDVAVPLLIQEILCAAALVLLAVLLLSVRSALGTPGAAARARAARLWSLIVIAVVAAGLGAITLLPIADTTFPTTVLSVLVILAAVLTRAGLPAR